jgi:hypothetical protein
VDKESKKGKQGWVGPCKNAFVCPLEAKTICEDLDLPPM